MKTKTKNLSKGKTPIGRRLSMNDRSRLADSFAESQQAVEAVDKLSNTNEARREKLE